MVRRDGLQHAAVIVRPQGVAKIGPKGCGGDFLQANDIGSTRHEFFQNDRAPNRPVQLLGIAVKVLGAGGKCCETRNAKPSFAGEEAVSQSF